MSLAHQTFMGIRYGGELEILDQTRLPHEVIWLNMRNLSDMIDAIVKLKVRGAPLIGISAAYFVANEVIKGAEKSDVLNCIAELRKTRPTAVNLFWAMDRLETVLLNSGLDDVVNETQKMIDSEISSHKKMAENGQAFIKDGDCLLTHCNTGGLATVGNGTALGVIVEAHNQGKKIHVFVDETRPLLQGARLTSWELKSHGISHDVICDNMAAQLMKKNKVDSVWVGADRVAENGDFANKIGTYGLGVLSSFHRVPMYCVAPQSTFDLDVGSGDEIEIEQRKPEEVLGFVGKEIQWCPEGVGVQNPAFDVTPVHLYKGLICENGSFSTEDLLQNGLIRLLKSRV